MKLGCFYDGKHCSYGLASNTHSVGKKLNVDIDYETTLSLWTCELVLSLSILCIMLRTRQNNFSLRFIETIARYCKLRRHKNMCRLHPSHQVSPPSGDLFSCAS